MNEGTSAITIATFLLYIGGVFLLAFFSHQLLSKKSFMGEYFLGSRSLGMWTFALTFAASSASGGSFIGYPSMVYTYGWVLALWIASYMIFPLVTMAVLGKRLNQIARKTGAITVPDVISDRFDSPKLGALTTLLIVVFMSAFLIGQFKAGSLILQTLLQDVPVYQATVAGFGNWIGWLPLVGVQPPGYVLCLIVFAVAVIAYTSYGGFHAVVWTDVMQGIVMCVGVVLMFILALWQVGGLKAAAEKLEKMIQSHPSLNFVWFGNDFRPEFLAMPNLYGETFLNRRILRSHEKLARSLISSDSSPAGYENPSVTYESFGEAMVKIRDRLSELPPSVADAVAHGNFNKV
mgnify:CR=1 FL=1